MLPICELLRRTRLDKGIGLATIAAQTRIDERYLRAIEADDRQSLPGAFFYKSFVHQYATCVGLDTKEIDAEVDRVLNAEAPMPLPGIDRQSAERLSFQSRPAAKYLSYAALRSRSGSQHWNGYMVAQEPRQQPGSTRFRSPGCNHACPGYGGRFLPHGKRSPRLQPSPKLSLP